MGETLRTKVSKVDYKVKFGGVSKNWHCLAQIQCINMKCKLQIDVYIFFIILQIKKLH